VRFVEWNALEQNKFYRYDYYRDNCSTRVRDALDRAVGGAIRAATERAATPTSYRWHTRRLVAGDAATYAGIQLALGRPADRDISAWEESFLPVRLMEHVRGVRVEGAGGALVPLVAREDTLYRARRAPERAVPPRTLGGFAAAGLGIAAGLAASGAARASAARRGRRSPRGRRVRRLTIAWTLVTGLAGVALLLAGTVTRHVYMGRNLNLAVVNPPRARRARRGGDRVRGAARRRAPPVVGARGAGRGVARRAVGRGCARDARAPRGAGELGHLRAGAACEPRHVVGLPRRVRGVAGPRAGGAAVSPLSVGVDVGGTYTDLAAVGDDGGVRSVKVLSDPADQSVGVLAALEALGGSPGDVARLVHGTTVVTNLLLERRGARVVLCATEGHTDVLQLRRQERARLYDLAAHHPPALVADGMTVAVPERVTPRGVARALAPEDAEAVAARVRALGPEAVAVALLHAHAHDAHERALGDGARAARCRASTVALSSEVLPEIREYERASTTAAEAYARPRVARYLGRLRDRLAAGGYPAPGVMTSGGGVRDAAAAARSAASLALSARRRGRGGRRRGPRRARRTRRLPAGAHDRHRRHERGRGADRGRGAAGRARRRRGGRADRAPRVLVETVSAGGGSVGWVDDAGALRVGPRSAGRGAGAGRLRAGRRRGDGDRRARRARPRAGGRVQRRACASTPGARTRPSRASASGSALPATGRRRRAWRAR
jgi:hypothetical protein